MINFSEHMVGRIYKVTLTDNSVIVGTCISYIPAKDNEPEVDAIWIENKNKDIKEILSPKIKQLDRCTA